MLLSLSLILLCGFALGGLFQKLNLPSLLGMMFTGVLLGPFVLNAIAPSILQIAPELRQIALIVILLRVGLSLNLKDLKKVGRPAVLMCFIPATIELAAVVVFAPLFLGVSYLEAAIMGCVLAAVSPAVVVPRMLKLMDSGYGKNKSIPQLILAAASVDDIYVIILFSSFLNMYQGQGFQFTRLLQIPTSIFLGIALGIAIGIVVSLLFQKFQIRDTIKILLLLAVSFLFVWFEEFSKPFFAISGLLAVIALGSTILKKTPPLAKRLSGKYAKVWVGAELFLFVLVGAAVDIRYLKTAGGVAVGFVLIALLFRVIAVFLCLLKTNFTLKERLFCAIAYLPKATVQAAIGSIPLALGVPAGNTILTVAVLAIFITAPIGAIGIDLSYEKLLSKYQ